MNLTNLRNRGEKWQTHEFDKYEKYKHMNKQWIWQYKQSEKYEQTNESDNSKKSENHEKYKRTNDSEKSEGVETKKQTQTIQITK